MPFKLLCLDIDGTLLNSNHEVSLETKRSIHFLPKDFPVVLVSARMPKGITFLHNQLHLKTPIICYSGALIVNPDRYGAYQPILNKTIAWDQMKNVYREAKKLGIHISFYKDDDWYIEKMDDWAEQESVITKTQTTIQRDPEPLQKANKILCMGTEEEIETLEQTLKQKYRQELTIYRSKPTYLEIMDHTVSKTSAIRFLQEKWNIKQEEIIAIGDNFNDIDMIQYAGLGVAMGNAPEQVQKMADEVTASNDHDGVARIIQKYLRESC